MVGLYVKSESLEEEKTKGHTQYQFQKPVLEAQDNSFEYREHLTITFQAMVDTIEGKKREMRNTTKEIERATNKATNIPPGRRRDTWIGYMEQWRAASVQNQLTEEEDFLCKQLVAQLALTDQTTSLLN